ncbi:hypothetical protein Dsin_011785 [Dipteronia sinensis]|uniref:FAR1 domain-containing protein n=1 Tax=Dipteronia sinensis TaxID=43782 RepID=A0AAE0AHS6_9ROSI|nr:hypothetical protein Dsin_011785 [Dipteronia sinensis]
MIKQEGMEEFVSKDSLPEVTVIEDDDENEIGNLDDVETNVEDPQIGKVYDSIECLFDYYKIYGKKKMGFEVIKRTSNKGGDGELRYVTFACARSCPSKSTSKNAVKMKPTSKINCKARLTASLCFNGKWQIRSLASLCFNGKWEIHSLVLDHNHKLGTPGKLRYFKTNRELKPVVKRKLELNDRAGIRPNKSYNSFAVEVGGHEKLTFLEKDCRNYLDKVRRLRLGEGDDNAIQHYFLRMQSSSIFFYTMDLDKYGRLKNVFGRMQGVEQHIESLEMF